jgi:hypothetical protein
MDGGGRATQDAKAEGWGEGIEKDNTLILITLTLALSTLVPNFVLPPPSLESSLKGEGIEEFCHQINPCSISG